MQSPSNRHPLVFLSVALVALVFQLGGCLSPDSVVCGDGRTCPAGTRCDDGLGLCVSDAQVAACASLNDGDACKVGLAPGSCRGHVCETFFCGDKKRIGAEACDGDDLGEKTCADLGFYRETTGLKCKDDCTFDTAGCADACGDKVLNQTKELCDGSDLGGADCRTAGFYDAPGLRCSPFCTFDVAQCTGFCGDAKMNGPEQCDGAPPLGKTCFDYGFDRGRVACSALCAPDLEGCDQIGWKTVLGGSFNGLWGAAGNDLFAVGPKGKIVRGGGTTWSAMTSGTTEDLFRVWGSGPDDVFAVGGSSILHWNGTAWSPMPLPEGVVPGVGPIWGDVWGSGPKDVYVVGFSGPILHWNGSEWLPLPRLPDDTWWSGIWGSGLKDVYVVGGMLRHWDGSRWTARPGPGPDKVWGSGPNDVFACGSGSCTHWDGTRWTETAWGSGVFGQVGSIWGSSPKDVLAIAGTHLMHWDGSGWSETSSPELPHAIWGTGPDDVYIAGGSGIHHRSGDSWRATTVPITISSLWAAGPNDLFVGGMPDKFACAPNSVECTPFLVPHVGQSFLPGWHDVVDVWGTSPSDVFAAVSGSVIHRWDGTGWSPSPGAPGARRIWGSGTGAVFALSGPRVGEQKPTQEAERSHIDRWDGQVWSPMPLPAVTRLLSGLWASKSGKAFAVGEEGEIVRWDGADWSAMDSGSTAHLIDVWGSADDDVYAVGTGGTLLHYDGATWSPMRSGAIPFDSTLFHVRGSGRGDVFVVGGYTQDATIAHPVGDLLLHLRGGDWERIALPPGTKLQDLAVTPSRVFLGEDTQVLQLERQGVTCDGRPEKTCGDGWDNDCDGLADQDDPDCKGKVLEICANLVDDDSNGHVDCKDPACATFPSCRVR